MPEYCYVCNGAHGPDEACQRERPGTRGPRRAAGGRLSDLIDDAPASSWQPEFGPVFAAGYDSECDACDGSIIAGDDIRAWTGHGYIHADDECERIARS